MDGVGEGEGTEDHLAEKEWLGGQLPAGYGVLLAGVDNKQELVARIEQLDQVKAKMSKTQPAV